MTQKLTTNDVAKIINRAPSTVLYFTLTGRLRFERTKSGIRLFDPADVERLADELRAKNKIKGGLAQ
jgi:DNA-binding transcriptional MerR regulator